jgi:hypothetical protein
MPDSIPAEVDPELTKRLGEIVICWAALEDWLSHLLTTLLGADFGAMAVVTVNVSSSSQIQWILTLLSIHVHKQPELQETIDLVKRADGLRGDRNALVHGLWSPLGCEPGTCLVNTVRWERSEVIREWMVTIADLDQLRDDIDQCVVDFMEIGRKFGFPRRRGETKSIFAD